MQPQVEGLGFGPDGAVDSFDDFTYGRYGSAARISDQRLAQYLGVLLR